MYRSGALQVGYGEVRGRGRCFGPAGVSGTRRGCVQKLFPGERQGNSGEVGKDFTYISPLEFPQMWSSPKPISFNLGVSIIITAYYLNFKHPFTKMRN